MGCLLQLATQLYHVRLQTSNVHAIGVKLVLELFHLFPSPGVQVVQLPLISFLGDLDFPDVDESLHVLDILFLVQLFLHVHQHQGPSTLHGGNRLAQVSRVQKGDDKPLLSIRAHEAGTLELLEQAVVLDASLGDLFAPSLFCFGHVFDPICRVIQVFLQTISLFNEVLSLVLQLEELFLKLLSLILQLLKLVGHALDRVTAVCAALRIHGTLRAEQLFINLLPRVQGGLDRGPPLRLLFFLGASVDACLREGLLCGDLALSWIDRPATVATLHALRQRQRVQVSAVRRLLKLSELRSEHPRILDS
mmetsp:Transcript_64963/g.152866  ORF Transcript_64963/g.152866 Transcript_64963/m.152866 type:complete len:306 (+) Transcript_64963:931-1848(+)